LGPLICSFSGKIIGNYANGISAAICYNEISIIIYLTGEPGDVLLPVLSLAERGGAYDYI